MFIDIVIVSAIGLLICLYGFFIERKLEIDQQYKAACDLSDQVSCTKTFLSPWGKFMGISNIKLGILFYTGMIVLAFLDQSWLLFLGAVCACLASVFLAYILYTQIKTLCLVCTSIYVVNAVLLYLTYQYLQ